MAHETSSFCKKISLIIMLLTLSSCAMLDDKLILKETNFHNLDGWKSDDHRQALASFMQSCKKFETLPSNKKIHISGLGGTYGDWKRLCVKAQSFADASDEMIRSFFESFFRPYLATNWGKADGLFTGYFEIELEGSRIKHGSYQYPIYRRPVDVKEGRKYYSRKKIENGALSGKGLEIVWVNDPVRLFFLHVQGSGRVKMDDGSVVRVGYNGKNGHKYSSIGRYMIDEGHIAREEVSAQSIKKWLYDNSRRAMSVLNKNPSYVFFRELGEEGPIGGQGVPLTPMRSLAVDKKFMPYGAPVWVDVELNKGVGQQRDFKKLLIAQDTGSAIKGPVRGDLFFGYGDEAEKLAGHQNNIGKYFILLPARIDL